MVPRVVAGSLPVTGTFSIRRRIAAGRWALAAAMVVVAGCTGAPDTGVTGTGASPRVGALAQERPGEPRQVMSAVVRAPAERTVVLGESGPQALSVAVSRALFDTAPVVVVATAADPAGVRAAAARSERLGVPLLLAERGKPTPEPSPTSSAATGPEASQELGREIRRLRPRAVLAADPAAVSGIGPLAGLSVVTDPAALPAVSPPRGVDGVAVLVAAGDDAAGSAGPAGSAGVSGAGVAAAVATARAAGAHVVRVRGGDPRADPDAIAALVTLRPRHVVAVGAGFGPADRLAARVTVATTGVQLPGGGQVMFPGRRLVALYGHPGAPALGVLGEQGLAAGIVRARALAARYRPLSGVPVVPAFEIIATVATGGAGPDGNYSSEASVASLRPWAARAAAAGVYLVLDLQPGRTDFLTQAKRYAPLLQLPYVGLALDPEWRLGPGQRHLAQIGSVSAREINAVSDWLARLTAAHHLPQKLLVLHQFRLSMIRDESTLDTSHDELAVLIHMDGQGPPPLKEGTWRAVTAAAPPGVWLGWKNFYDEDKPTLTPPQTMRHRPAPVMISYQ